MHREHQQKTKSSMKHYRLQGRKKCIKSNDKNGVQSNYLKLLFAWHPDTISVQATGKYNKATTRFSSACAGVSVCERGQWGTGREEENPKLSILKEKK